VRFTKAFKIAFGALEHRHAFAVVDALRLLTPALLRLPTLSAASGKEG